MGREQLMLTVKGKEKMMSLMSSVYNLLTANRKVGAKIPKRTLSLIVGSVVLVLAIVAVLAVLSIVETGAGGRIPLNEGSACSKALASRPVGEAFVRSVA